MSQQEYTGGSVSYYTVRVERPTNTDAAPYSAECNDIIEALGMNYAEGNAFKALWRRCAARNLGLAKHGYKDGLYDAEKVVFFGQRMVSWERYKREHCGEFEKLMAELDPVVVANVAAFNADWPNEQRRQDAAAEDEAFAAIEASQPKAWHDFPDAPDWDSHSWPQIVKDDSGRWWGVKAGWKMSISHGFKGDCFSILNGDGELLKRGSDPMNWRSSLQQRPYTGQGGVMIKCPGCVAASCECRP